MDCRPVLPTLRAAVFAAVCVALAESAHRLMSSGAVPLRASVGAAGVVFVLARAVAGRERGLTSITALMLMVQGGLHVWFNTAQRATAADSAAHDACAAMAPMPGMDPAAMCPPHQDWAVSALLHTSGGMLAAHALAALITAWWLRRGEAALFRLAALLAVVLHGITFAVRIACAAPAVARTGGVRPNPAAAGGWRPGWLDILRYTVARRGPPRVGIAR